jgi:TPR repeat protein
LVVLSIAESKLVLHVRDADKLWALKSSLEISLVHIAGVRADPEAARGWSPHRDDPSEDVPARGGFARLKNRAQSGDREAQNNFGLCFQFGYGTEQDYGEAAVWFRRAGEGGLATAQFNLGGLYPALCMKLCVAQK